VAYARRGFEEKDLEGRFLAVVATPDSELNRRVARLCRERDALCNVVDAPEDCSFVVPAHFELDDLCVAVSTGGSSPAMARVIREDLQQYLASRYQGVIAVMGRLRPLVLALGLESRRNAELFRRLARSELPRALEDHDHEMARRLLRDALPPELEHHIDGLLHGLA